MVRHAWRLAAGTPLGMTKDIRPTGRDLAAVGVVGALALVEAAQVWVGLALLDAPVTWGQAVQATAPSWMVLVVLVIPLLRLLDRFGTGRLTSVRILALAVGAALFSGLHLAGSALLWEWLAASSSGFAARFYRLATLYFVPDVLTFTAVVTGHSVARRYREDRAREVEEAARRAEDAQARFQALRRQLRPDFFFNTLNAVAGLVARGDATRSLDALSSLSTLLRVSLTVDPGRPARLDDEVELAAEYLAIQGLRFPDRLRAACDVEERAGACAVPPLLLVQLVEAVVDRGIESGRPFALRITASERAGRLVVEIAHTAPQVGDDTLDRVDRRVRGFDGTGSVVAHAGEVSILLHARPPAWANPHRIEVAS